MVRCDLAERAALLAEDPETFFVTPHYQTYPGVIVQLADQPFGGRQSPRLGKQLTQLAGSHGGEPDET